MLNQAPSRVQKQLQSKCLHTMYVCLLHKGNRREGEDWGGNAKNM